MTDKNLTPPRTKAPSTSYQVGYGRTPVGSRFAKGRSGNPSGKPKGVHNKLPALNEERLKKIILEEAYRTIEIREDGVPLTITMAQAAVRSLAVAAVEGKPYAQALFVKLVAAVEHQNKELHRDFFDAVIDYKLKWENELARRQKLGLHLPDPVPHPDHVVIDMMTGTARVDGPWTKEERTLLDDCQAAADAEGKELRDWLSELKNEADEGPDRA